MSDLGVETFDGLKKRGVTGGDGFAVLEEDGIKSRVALMLARHVSQVQLVSLRQRVDLGVWIVVFVIGFCLVF